MKAHYKLAAMTSMLLVLGVQSFVVDPERKRGGRRQNHRNREARRRGPAHEGHRHVEGPVLRQAAREQPAHLENVVVGRAAVCRTWFSIFPRD